MTMSSMDKYFEDRGFKVVRKYLPAPRVYKFDISKGGYAKQYFWEYPSGTPNTDKQIEDMDAMINDFYDTIQTNTKCVQYSQKDVEMTYNLKVKLNSIYGDPGINIEKVIFNKPATIVLWSDGTKTVVKAQGKSRYDKEKGLAMAIAKKVLGNKGNYYNTFAKWLND